MSGDNHIAPSNADKTKGGRERTDAQREENRA